MIAIVLAACSDSSGHNTDAAPDAAQCVAPLGLDLTDCVPAGLDVDLNGTWLLTGAKMSDPFFTNMWTSTDVMYTVSIVREGTGPCGFGLSLSGEATVDAKWFVTDTYAGYYQPAEGARVPEIKQRLCRGTADQLLHYSSYTQGYAMQHQYASKLDGTLRR